MRPVIWIVDTLSRSFVLLSYRLHAYARDEQECARILAASNAYYAPFPVEGHQWYFVPSGSTFEIRDKVTDTLVGNVVHLRDAKLITHLRNYHADPEALT